MASEARSFDSSVFIDQIVKTAGTLESGAGVIDERVPTGQCTSDTIEFSVRWNELDHDNQRHENVLRTWPSEWVES